MTNAVSIIVEMKRRKEPTTPKLMIKGSDKVTILLLEKWLKVSVEDSGLVPTVLSCT
jgi:hypothetical protein